MICPNCKRETSSLSRMCNLCGADLEGENINDRIMKEQTNSSIKTERVLSVILLFIGGFSYLCLIIAIPTGFVFNKIFSSLIAVVIFYTIGYFSIKNGIRLWNAAYPGLFGNILLIIYSTVMFILSFFYVNFINQNNSEIDTDILVFYFIFSILLVLIGLILLLYGLKGLFYIARHQTKQISNRLFQILLIACSFILISSVGNICMVFAMSLSESFIHFDSFDMLITIYFIASFVSFILQPIILIKMLIIYKYIINPHARSNKLIEDDKKGMLNTIKNLKSRLSVIIPCSVMIILSILFITVISLIGITKFDILLVILFLFGLESIVLILWSLFSKEFRNRYSGE